MGDAVRDTKELRRVLGLPRRPTTDADHAQLALEMTELLKRPGGTMTLRPVQALALHDIAIHRGGFFPIGVGVGKTLTTLMASYILRAVKPMLFLPAGLIENAERAREIDLAPHWLLPKNLRIMSYEMLGRVQSADELESYAPDALIFDEAHRIKNTKAACTRRIARYMAAHPRTPFCAFSGTIMRDSILDFAHILWWSLKEGTPLPQSREELDEWASALDVLKIGRPGQEYQSLGVGALLQFASREPTSGGSDLERARRGFRSRLVETPGVVATAGVGGDEAVDASIHLRAIPYAVSAKTEGHFRTLRGDGSSAEARLDYPGWQRPDGKEFEQGVEVWNCARQLALGLHYAWDPPPPDDWMIARKAWSKFVRNILTYSRTYDSPQAVVLAIDAGLVADPTRCLEAWRKVRGSFRPVTVPVWHDESVLELCAKWGSKAPGIIWTEHGHFGRRLAKEMGVPYFGAKGRDVRGGYIEDADCSRCIVASIDANRDGRNLQGREASPDTAWSPARPAWDGFGRNLIVSPPDGALEWQQCIARTHRSKQRRDEVIVDFLLGCREHVGAWRKALIATEAIRDTVGGTPKLFLATPDVPPDEVIDSWRGWRW